MTRDETGLVSAVEDGMDMARPTGMTIIMATNERITRCFFDKDGLCADIRTSLAAAQWLFS